MGTFTFTLLKSSCFWRKHSNLEKTYGDAKESKLTFQPEVALVLLLVNNDAVVVVHLRRPSDIALQFSDTMKVRCQKIRVSTVGFVKLCQFNFRNRWIILNQRISKVDPLLIWQYFAI